MKPLIKWAGGKRQIMKEIRNSLPNKWRRYYEPFFGGGALFFELYEKRSLTESIISDLNPDLFNLYTLIKEYPSEISKAISELRFKNNRDDYYRAREVFNSLKTSGQNIQRAALFIYINRHCYNGLYRVNSRNDFNVPFGKYTNPSLPTEERITKISKALAIADIVNKDFEDVVENAREGDFVYFDPPYEPLSKTSHFTSYTSNGFTWNDQLRLRDVSMRLWRKGVFVMISNSKVPRLKELYKDFHVNEVTVTRMINSNTGKRRNFSELIITNYEGDAVDYKTQSGIVVEET